MAPLKLFMTKPSPPVVRHFHVYKDVAPLKRRDQGCQPGHRSYFHVYKDVAPLKQAAFPGGADPVY